MGQQINTLNQRQYSENVVLWHAFPVQNVESIFFFIEQIIKSYMQNLDSLNYMLKQLNTSYSHFISGSLKRQLTVY